MARPEELQWRRIWVSVGYVLVINVLVFALMPLSGATTMIIPYGDKIAHGIVFMLLMIWFSGLVPPRFYPRLFLALLGYGIVIEVLQNFTTYRTMELADVLADGLGLFIGWGLALAGMRHWATRLEGRFRRS